MALQLTVLQKAMFAALSTGFVAATGSAFAQAVPEQRPERLERVEVTGSNIKRTDTETVAPVDVITREEIARSGRPNVAEVLRSLPINAGGSFGESATNSFAPGAAGISLRGLGQKTTLVLLNGRRVAGYGFAQNLQDSFVDLNSIPTAAIDRIEILKDGASAIYGSDAIAGVVNIILRHDYVGVEGSVGGGYSEGKKEYQGNLTYGFGDLTRDRFNVFATLEAYKRENLELSDTTFGHTRDMRGYNGGRNFTSLTGGGTWRQVTGTATLTNNYRAISGCQGQVLNGQQAAAAGLINLSPNQSAATLATNTAMAAATNTFCSKDFNDVFDALPETERVGILSRGTFQFAPNAQGYLEVGLNRVKTKQTFQQPFFAGTTGLQQTAAGLRPFVYNVTFSPGVAGNPYATNARYVGVLQDFGTRNSDIRSDTARVLTGAIYTLGTWDFDSAVGYSKNRAETYYTNRTTLAGTSAAFNVPTTAQPPVPISTASTYNLDNPALNSDAVRAQQRIDFSRRSNSELGFVDTKATTEIQQIRLPGGPVAVALGAEARKEKLRDQPDINATNGNILGQGITATDGDRTNYAGYVEFALPFFKGFEAQIAGRYDHYSDYGSSKTPKAGVKWQANDVLLLRANWGHGFRAPTLPEISPSVATFFTSVIDPDDGVSRQVSGVYAGNPSLKPETSTSGTAGFIIEPNKDVNLGVDVYRIRYRNVVASPTFQSIVNASCPAGGPGCPNTANIVRDPSTNQIVTVLSNYQNLNERRTTGVDIDFKYALPTTVFGKFTAKTGVTYIHTFSENGVECVGHNGCTNTIPRVKGVAGIDWEYGPATVSGRMNYTHGYYQDLLTATYFATTNDPRFQNGTYPTRIPSYRTYDLFGKYDITKNISISASVINVFGQKPPYDPGFSSTFLYDYSIYDIRTQQYRAYLTVKM